MKRLVALAIVAGFVAVWLVRPVHAPILLYLSKAETSLPGPGSGPGKITGKALLVLEGKFQKAEFFAAFAAGSEGRFYWVGGRHTAAEARHDALAMCPGCTVIAERGPVGFQANHVGVTVSQGAAERAALVLPKKPSRREVYYALAGDGSWAVQLAQDGWLVPGWWVLSRCRAHFAKGGRPLDMGVIDCQLYRGPVLGAGADG